MFFGLGSDGTVSANRNSVKIVGENTPLHAQGYFVYDSRKAGSVTTSHVRFSPRPIKGSYLVHRANFVACHQFQFLERIDMLSMADPGATFLLNSPYGPDEVWDKLPAKVQQQIIDKKLKFYVVDAYRVAREAEMGVRINTVMQTCFFKLANIIPPEEAIAQIKDAIKKTYGKKGGGTIVERNNAAVDGALASLAQVKVPGQVTSTLHMVPPVPADAPAFVKDVLGMMIANRGDDLPVSAMPCDGTFPTGTTQYEKRSIAQDIPIWDAKICIQCGLCSLACPHATIRMKAYDPALLAGAPEGFKSTDWKGKEYPGWKMTLQVAPDDCTGCGLCVDVCPAKDKEVAKHKAIDMEPKLQAPRAASGPLRLLPQPSRRRSQQGQGRHDQGLAAVAAAVRVLRGLRRLRRNALCQAAHPVLRRPHVDRQRHRLLVDLRRQPALHALYGQPRRARARHGPTRCSRTAPSSAWASAWPSTSRSTMPTCCCGGCRGNWATNWSAPCWTTKQDTDEEIAAAARPRGRVAASGSPRIGDPDAKNLAASADYLIRKSVWSFGGDGWAYDIGFGGLDHVFASGRDVNILVLDTEVYSNTGGQASKSTPRGAVAKFAAGGKPGRKKDLGMIAMAYGNVFVGQISLGANPPHAIKTIRAAESYRGTSLLIAFSHCIGWGIDMTSRHELAEGGRGLRLLAVVSFRPPRRGAPVPS